MTDPMQPTEPEAPMEPTAPMAPAAPPPAAPMAPPSAPVGWSAPAAPAIAVGGGGPRPTGATVISIIAFIEGVLIVLAGLFVILGMSVVGGLVGSSDTTNAAAAGGFLAGLGVVLGIIVFVIGALYLLIGYGVWRARRWSWMLGMVVYIIALVFGVLGLANNVNVTSLIISVILPAVVLFFLWQPDVKRYLGRA